MSLKAVNLTPRQIVLQYAKMHGLAVGGSERDLITVQDKQGHWSESWRLSYCEKWAEVESMLRQIERHHAEGVARPWEAARKSYTGKMKPLAA